MPLTYEESNWDSLLQYARRELFVRQKILPAMPANGMCEAMAVHWLAEKLTDDTSFKGIKQRFGFRKTQYTYGALHDVASEAADLQNTYSTTANVTQLYRNLGLVVNEDLMSSFTVTNVRNRHNLADPDILASVSDACGRLSGGQGFIANISFGPGQGHALSFYKSRGDKLHFFDPNCGIFDVQPQRIVNFMGEWLIIHTRMGLNVTFAPWGSKIDFLRAI